MLRELPFYGVLVSPLLPWTLLTFAAAMLLRRVLRAIGFYRRVWHRPLFDTALFVIVLGGVVALSSWFAVL